MPGVGNQKKTSTDPDLEARRQRTRDAMAARGMAPGNVNLASEKGSRAVGGGRTDTGIGPTVRLKVRGPIKTAKYKTYLPVTLLSTERADGELASRIPISARTDDVLFAIAPATKADGSQTGEELRLVEFKETFVELSSKVVEPKIAASWDTPPELMVGAEFDLENARAVSAAWDGVVLFGDFRFPESAPHPSFLLAELPTESIKQLANDGRNSRRNAILIDFHPALESPWAVVPMSNDTKKTYTLDRAAELRKLQPDGAFGKSLSEDVGPAGSGQWSKQVEGVSRTMSRGGVLRDSASPGLGIPFRTGDRKTDEMPRGRFTLAGYGADQRIAAGDPPSLGSLHAYFEGGEVAKEPDEGFFEAHITSPVGRAFGDKGSAEYEIVFTCKAPAANEPVMFSHRRLGLCLASDELSFPVGTLLPDAARDLGFTLLPASNAVVSIRGVSQPISTKGNDVGDRLPSAWGTIEAMDTRGALLRIGLGGLDPEVVVAKLNEMAPALEQSGSAAAAAKPGFYPVATGVALLNDNPSFRDPTLLDEWRVKFDHQLTLAGRGSEVAQCDIVAVLPGGLDLHLDWCETVEALELPPTQLAERVISDGASIFAVYSFFPRVVDEEAGEVDEEEGDEGEEEEEEEEEEEPPAKKKAKPAEEGAKKKKKKGRH